MQSFEVRNESCGSFVGRCNEAISDKDAGHVLTVAFDGAQLVVSFNYLGRSTLCYEITPIPNGFRADLLRKKISTLHAPFRKAFDERFEKVVQDLGGQLVEQ